MWKQHYYDYDIKNPEIIKLCESCTRDDCPGTCMEYKNLSRKLVGMNPLPFRQKPKRVPSPLYVYNKGYEANGETHTIREWARISGLPYHTLYSRVTRGMSMQDAIKKPSRYNWHSRAISYAGKQMPLMDWAKELGIKYSTLKRRLQLDWTLEDAFETPVLPHGISREEWKNGEHHHTARDNEESYNADR